MNCFRHFFVAISAFTISTIYAIAPSLQKEDISYSIQETIEEVNETLFSKKGLRIDLLKNHPDLIPLLAEWEYQDWHSYDPSLTRERLERGFNRLLNDSHLPLAFVVLEDSIAIGVISLNDKSEPELSDLEDGNPWGGSFHITSAKRNQGVGEDMTKTLISLAKHLRYEKIHFYTSNFDMVKWYTKRGAQIVETRPYRDHVITIMEYSLEE